MTFERWNPTGVLAEPPTLGPDDRLLVRLDNDCVVALMLDSRPGSSPRIVVDREHTSVMTLVQIAEFVRNERRERSNFRRPLAFRRRRRTRDYEPTIGQLMRTAVMELVVDKRDFDAPVRQLELGLPLWLRVGESDIRTTFWSSGALIVSIEHNTL